MRKKHASPAATSVRRGIRGTLSAAMSLFVVAASVFVATPAMAAPVYQIEAAWAPGTPATVAAGDIVTAEWRVNVNDDAEAPSNEPVDNVLATLTVEGGVFTAIPDVCLTEGVTPISSISEDGTTLVCNLGTRDQGTSAVFRTTVEANGATGDEIRISGAVEGDTAEVDPIPTENPFSMDLTLGTPTSGWERSGTTTDLPFQWSLLLGANSEAGPDSITYELTTTVSTGAAVAVGPGACQPFTVGVANEHPWTSGDHPADQISRFVDSCTLTQTSPTTFALTLSGIDYSAIAARQEDSTGAAISPTIDVIATGEIVFRVATAAPLTIDLAVNTPTYTSVTGATVADDPSNNQAQKTATTFGPFATTWNRAFTNSGGSNWDDSYRVPAGTTVAASAVTGLGALDGGNSGPNGQYGLCQVLDSRYVTYDSLVLNSIDPEGVVYEYYVGTAATVDADSASYDPNAFTCNEGGADIGATGWTTVEPTDKSLVKAVRAQIPFSSLNSSGNSAIVVRQTIKPDVAPGQDIWEFGGYRRNGAPWIANAPATGITETPDARYPFTSGQRRDILRVSALEPLIEKTADRNTAQPGDAIVYSLGYYIVGNTATGTVDDVVLTDELPVGTTYIPASSTPEPAVTTRDDGGQTLTWTLDGVPVETQQTLTYQTRVGDDVEPGSTLTNTARAAVAGVRSDPSVVDVEVPDDGFTTIGKTADLAYIPNENGDGVGEGSWTVTLRSQDPTVQAFTDTIDILPYNGDGRGTSFSGSYALTDVTAPAGSTIYYTDAPPTSLSDDPSDASNGAAGDPAGNTVGWSTTRPDSPTAIRVVGPELLPGDTHAFTVGIATDGVIGGDVLVNRAQGIAEHTGLVMRTSAPISVANFYSASLKKYVQNETGEWVDANTVEEYPTYRVGDTVPYRIVIVNTGQGTLTDLVITDDLFPEGSFTVDELAPGAEEVHEFEIVLEEGGLDTVVNTACATAATPEDSGVPPTINCDPAGFEVEGEPTHTKSIVSAEPIGGGQWEIVYGLEVINESTASTSYSLADALHFTDQVDIVSAEVTGSPDGVTLAEPAWDGQANLDVATDVALLGSDDNGYAPHTYLLTVVADVPLQFAPGGDLPATECAAEGEDTDTAFNNTSELTLPNGDVEPDQACATPPSIDIIKSVSDGPTANGDGTWTVTYDVVATNTGGATGVYDISDRMTADGDLEVVSGSVTSAPEGVTPSATWTGLGAEGADENVIATGVELPAGSTHTYQVEVIIGLAEGTDGAPVITDCAADPGEAGGLSNTAEIEHNDLTDDASACITVGVVTVDKSVSSGPTPNGDGTWTVVYDIVATHVGAADADYDVTDRLHFGEGIEIVAHDVRSLDGIDVNADWTGLGAADSDPENLVAEGVTLSEGESHTYQVEVTVQMDEATMDPSDLQCAPGGSGEAGGLGNSTTLTSNGITGEDEVCPTLPLIELDKEIVEGSPVENGDGTWTIAYDVTATNTGAAEGDYDLSDRLRYGDGIEVASATVISAPDGVETNAGWTGQGAEGADENVITTDVTLAAGSTHTYRVEVIASMDRAVVTPGDLVCPAPDSDADGGFANTAGLVHNGEDQDAEACVSPPLIEITKSLSGAVTPVDGEDGVYDATYELTVTNSGAGAGVYDLDDQLAPGEGVTVVGIRSVTSDATDAVAINEGFNGVDDLRIVTGQPIAAADGAPIVHTYTVTVRYAADLSGIEMPTGDTCTTDEGAPLPGTLNNTATVGWNGLEGDDAECIRPGQPTLDKALVSATPAGNGQWEVVYDLTVGNVGTEATTYDLDDEFLFAQTVTVDSVSVTGPEGVAIDGAFDGDANQRIATDVGIIGLDDEGYAPHVYRVTVLANVPLHFDSDAVGEDGTGSPACTAPAGGNLIEQGLNNAATLTDETGGTITDTDCASLPSIAITKSMDGDPVKGANGQWTVNYVITAINNGAAAGDYTLTDELRYGAGIEVLDATVTEAPEGVVPAATWTGLGESDAEENVIATDVALSAGGTHTYRVTVTAHLDTAAADASTLECPAPGSDGRGGFANTAGLNHNDLTTDAAACAVPEWPEDVPPPLAITGGEIAVGVLGVGLLLLVAGGILLYTRRRVAAE